MRQVRCLWCWISVLFTIGLVVVLIHNLPVTSSTSVVWRSLSTLRVKIHNILTKTETLRITLNIDVTPTESRSHTHPSHSETSRLLTSSLYSCVLTFSINNKSHLPTGVFLPMVHTWCIGNTTSFQTVIVSVKHDVLHDVVIIFKTRVTYVTLMGVPRPSRTSSTITMISRLGRIQVQISFWIRWSTRKDS
jgi:hypothetical protein